MPAELPALLAAAEVACYRIAAEAVANAARHSGARSVLVRLEAGPQVVRLDVVDDGTGVRPGAPSRGTGLGLASMRLRAEELGGTLTLDSSPAGTRIHVELPR